MNNLGYLKEDIASFNQGQLPTQSTHSSLHTSIPNSPSQSKLIDEEGIINILTLLQEDNTQPTSGIKCKEEHLYKDTCYPVVKYDFIGTDYSRYDHWCKLVLEYGLDYPLRNQGEILDPHNVLLPEEFMNKLKEMCKKIKIYPIIEQTIVPPPLDRSKIRAMFTKLESAFWEAGIKVEEHTRNSQKLPITDPFRSSFTQQGSQNSSYRPSSQPKPAVPSRYSEPITDPFRSSFTQQGSQNSSYRPSSQSTPSVPSRYSESSSQPKPPPPFPSYIAFSSQPKPPPLPHLPISQPKKRITDTEGIFPPELQVLQIARGKIPYTGELLPEEFKIGFGLSDNPYYHRFLGDISHHLLIDAGIASAKPKTVTITNSDGSTREKKVNTKTIHEHDTTIGNYIVLTFKNIENIIKHFDKLNNTQNHLFKFLTRIHDKMSKYELTQETTGEFKNFSKTLSVFLSDQFIKKNPELFRYKYLKYKHKYLELKK